jgi:hypothetical protein
MDSKAHHREAVGSDAFLARPWLEDNKQAVYNAILST